MKYPLSIRLMHWLSTLIILGLLTLGVYMTPFDEANAMFADNLYFWHKSFGLLMLLMVIARIYNRRQHVLPDLPKIMPAHEKQAAKWVHRLLYALMIFIPLLGYIQSSAYEFSSGVHFFFIDLPELIPNNQMTFDVTNFLHKWTAYLLILFISVHVLGALKHRFFDKENDVLNRIT